jgi:hypothetical protein
MLDRRSFLTALVATAVSSATRGQRADATAPWKAGENLIPDEPSSVPNYWCTWAAQNYLYGHDLGRLDTRLLEGESGSKLAHDAMTEHVLFGDGGWLQEFYPKVRKDIYFLLDDGWQTGGTATFELDSTKFPSFTGSPIDRLSKLHKTIENAKWRGAALWCRNTPGGDADHHLEMLSQSAGIKYWKIDIGDPTFNLVRLRNKTHIQLTLEHVHGEPPMNGDWRNDGRFGPQPWGSRRMRILQNTDVYRTYDVTSILSLPTTLDRLAEMLRGSEGHPEIGGLLNVEDEVYVAAAMGCTMGILRHPLHGMRPGPDVDLFFNGPRQAKRRMDEVVRGLRWQRIAPPFSPGAGTVNVSTEILTDNWIFERGQTWQNEIIGANVRQGAPACVARNINLPNVHANGEKPFVLATRFPNGAVAIASQERTTAGRGWYTPRCDLTLHVSDAPGPFGIFGHFGSVTFTFAQTIAGRQILAQDLAGDESFDITKFAKLQGKSLFIPGDVIRTIGLMNATPGDLSSPGLMIAIS